MFFPKQPKPVIRVGSGHRNVSNFDRQASESKTSIAKMNARLEAIRQSGREPDKTLRLKEITPVHKDKGQFYREFIFKSDYASEIDRKYFNSFKEADEFKITSGITIREFLKYSKDAA